MPAQYIIRLDDASEYMDYDKWNPYFEIFDRYHLNPIIAVIPYNKDPKLIHNHPDTSFWEKVRLWQKKGYRIALHGYEHLYQTADGGIIGMNNRSEFAGIDPVKQKDMLLQGIRKFKDEGIETEIFVAPAHSFDKKTLSAIKEVTKIQTISDGFFIHPVYRDGINWIPQQLWEPVEKSTGVWTICCHPEISQTAETDKLFHFIKEHFHLFTDPLSLHFEHARPDDILYFHYRKNYFKIRNLYYKLKSVANPLKQQPQ